MSLWIAVLWLGYAAVCLGIFVICRHRVADIAHQVADETDHRVRRVLEAERTVDEQLCQAFVAFDNPAEAVQNYKTAQAKIEGIPRANPPWSWTADDLEQFRKRSVAQETAHRSRPPIVVSIIGVLALTLAAAIATTILSNSVQPVLATPSSPAGTAGQAGNVLPPSVSLPTTPPSFSAPLPSSGGGLSSPATPVDSNGAVPAGACTSGSATQPGGTSNDQDHSN